MGEGVSQCRRPSSGCGAASASRPPGPGWKRCRARALSAPAPPPPAGPGPGPDGHPFPVGLRLSRGRPRARGTGVGTGTASLVVPPVDGAGLGALEVMGSKPFRGGGSGGHARLSLQGDRARDPAAVSQGSVLAVSSLFDSLSILYIDCVPYRASSKTASHSNEMTPCCTFF